MKKLEKIALKIIYEKLSEIVPNFINFSEDDSNIIIGFNSIENQKVLSKYISILKELGEKLKKERDLVMNFVLDSFINDLNYCEEKYRSMQKTIKENNLIGAEKLNKNQKEIRTKIIKDNMNLHKKFSKILKIIEALLEKTET